MNTHIFKYSMIGILALAAVLTIIPSAFATNGDDGFTFGYNNGVEQGTIAHNAHVFHIGTVCIGNTEAWCNGYIAGYLDGFFQSGFPTTSSHTTVTIHEGGGHGGGGHGPECDRHGNSTMSHCPPEPKPKPPLCEHGTSCPCPKGKSDCVTGPGSSNGSNGGSTGGSTGGSMGGSSSGGSSDGGSSSGSSLGGSSSGGSGSGGGSSGGSSSGSSGSGSSSSSGSGGPLR